MIKIVIIEDLPIVLEGLKLLIGKVKDFQIVAEYNNGKEFIDAIDNFNADIVLTDIDMPLMDGIETTKLALSFKPDIKIIALSRHTDRKFYYKW
ncbi:MAG: response regulator transcription factor [Chloroflexia bacterium]|nr:response regulator transcription factor [Chloroflexia bacterium]